MTVQSPPAHPVTYLVSQYPAVSHTFILREVRHLRRQGWDLRVVSINPADRAFGDLTSDEQDESRQTFVIKERPVSKVLGGLKHGLTTNPSGLLRGLMAALSLSPGGLRAAAYQVFYWLEALILVQAMATFGSWHVHVHFATPAAMVALIAHRMAGVRYSLTIHGPTELFDVHLYRLREKCLAATGILAISDFARSQILRLLPSREWSKVQVSRLGVDPEAFSPRPHPETDVHEILCLGRLTPDKGQGVLIEALALLQERGVTAHLRFAGDGADRDRLEALVRERGLEEQVTFEGRVSPDKVVDLYERAALFVLPSFAEGVPVVLMEAMSREIPCISTVIAGIPELIRDGETGRLTPPGNVDALADAIADLLANPERAGALGRAGRRKVIADYNLAANTDRMGDLLAAIVAEAPGRLA